MAITVAHDPSFLLTGAAAAQAGAGEFAQRQQQQDLQRLQIALQAQNQYANQQLAAANLAGDQVARQQALAANWQQGLMENDFRHQQLADRDTQRQQQAFLQQDRFGNRLNLQQQKFDLQNRNMEFKLDAVDEREVARLDRGIAQVQANPQFDDLTKQQLVGQLEAQKAGVNQRGKWQPINVDATRRVEKNTHIDEQGRKWWVDPSDRSPPVLMEDLANKGKPTEQQKIAQQHQQETNKGMQQFRQADLKYEQDGLKYADAQVAQYEKQRAMTELDPQPLSREQYRAIHQDALQRYQELHPRPELKRFLPPAPPPPTAPPPRSPDEFDRMASVNDELRMDGNLEGMTMDSSVAPEVAIQAIDIGSNQGLSPRRADNEFWDNEDRLDNERRADNEFWNQQDKLDNSRRNNDAANTAKPPYQPPAHVAPAVEAIQKSVPNVNVERLAAELHDAEINDNLTGRSGGQQRMADEIKQGFARMDEIVAAMQRTTVGPIETEKLRKELIELTHKYGRYLQ